MALVILDRSTCPICGGVLRSGDEMVASSGPFPLHIPNGYDFVDAAMHRGCFLAWEHRATFVTDFNSFHRDILFKGGVIKRMSDDGSIALTTPSA